MTLNLIWILNVSIDKMKKEISESKNTNLDTEDEESVYNERWTPEICVKKFFF